MKPIKFFQDVNFSAHGEIFLESKGKYISFPVNTNDYSSGDKYKRMPISRGNNCRQNFVFYLASSFTNLRTQIQANPDLQDAKMVNIPAIKVDGKLIPAKGSIGVTVYAETSQDAIYNPKITIPLFDYIVGNTMVLVDQKNNKIIREFRKTFGRAGDFDNDDKKSLVYHGLSNSWLRHPVLASLASGLIRTATNISSQTREYEGCGIDYLNQLFKLVPSADIIKAIDNNDFELAKKNWDKIGPFIAEICQSETNFPITALKLPIFNYFISKGMDYWFDKYEMVTAFENYRLGGEAHYGVEQFLEVVVKRDIEDEQVRLKPQSFYEIWKDKTLDKKENTVNIEHIVTGITNIQPMTTNIQPM